MVEMVLEHQIARIPSKAVAGLLSGGTPWLIFIELGFFQPGALDSNFPLHAFRNSEMGVSEMRADFVIS